MAPTIISTVKSLSKLLSCQFVWGWKPSAGPNDWADKLGSGCTALHLYQNYFTVLVGGTNVYHENLSQATTSTDPAAVLFQNWQQYIFYKNYNHNYMLKIFICFTIKLYCHNIEVKHHTLEYINYDFRCEHHVTNRHNQLQYNKYIIQLTNSIVYDILTV